MKTTLLLSVFIVFIFAFGCKPATNEPVKSKTDSLTVAKSSDNMRMITAKIFVKKEKLQDFIKAARGMIDSTMKEPGCESYMLYQNPFEPAKLIFVETYKNQAAIDAHFASSYFKNFGPVIKDWLSEPSEIKIYDIAAIK
jgi:quinol monooxygenase YgiN